MNTPNQDQNQTTVKVSPLVQELQKITKKENASEFNKIENEIKGLVSNFNKVLDGIVTNIQQDIADTGLDERLGRDMSEEDVDKMLLVYGECTLNQLDNLSLAKKRGKVVKMIEDLGDKDCREYDLATKTRIASLQNKLVEALKADVLGKFRDAANNKIEQNNQPVEQKRKDLANQEQYKKEIEDIKQAQAETAIRQTRKKRAAKRKAAINAAAEAGISATLDNCVQKTRENILANFDNAVDLTKAAINDRVNEGKDPQSEADEIREEVKETLKDNSKYKLQDINVGSDNVTNSPMNKMASLSSKMEANEISDEQRQGVNSN